MVEMRSKQQLTSHHVLGRTGSPLYLVSLLYRVKQSTLPPNLLGHGSAVEVQSIILPLPVLQGGRVLLDQDGGGLVLLL